MPDPLWMVFLVGPAMWLWLHLKWWIEERRKSVRSRKNTRTS